ncbi:MAG: T9SS type A sorting domain-containing protein [Bacteroidia bacterium]|nr:T9SS type A sorting domain-containing protein [Bacteroidia bacterium]MDW8301272.1 T9SS type A sorting domain-containing protein [Bacteroidia bacterium]
MKRLIYLLALVSIVAVTYAQNLQVPISIPKWSIQAVKEVPYPRSPLLQQNGTNYKTTTLGERWYNYVEASQIVHGNSSLPEIFYMFPDSNIQARFGPTVAYPMLHGYALMLDPSATVFGNSLVPGSSNLTILRSGTSTSGVYTYYLDSLVIPYFYQRPPSMPTSIKDTVVLQIIPCSRYVAPASTVGIPAQTPMMTEGGGLANSWENYFFSPTGALWLHRYGEDTVNFTALGFNQNTWRIPATPTQYRLYKIPLGQSDTSFLTKSLKISMASYGYTTPYKIPGAKIGSDSSSKNIVIFMYYKPGQSWTPMDMLDVNIANATRSVFSPIYLEERGNDTYPIYDGNTLLSERPHAGYVKGYNMSYPLLTPTRYKYPSPSWGSFGVMLPTTAFDSTFSFEYPLWYAKLRQAASTVSISENNQNTITLEQPYPNPAYTQINIPYAISEAGQVEIIITNVVGQTMKNVINQVVSPGKYNVAIDITDLSSGMYLCILKTSKGILTSKFVVGG